MPLQEPLNIVYSLTSLLGDAVLKIINRHPLGTRSITLTEPIPISKGEILEVAISERIYTGVGESGYEDINARIYFEKASLLMAINESQNPADAMRTMIEPKLLAALNTLCDSGTNRALKTVIAKHSGENQCR